MAVSVRSLILAIMALTVATPICVRGAEGRAKSTASAVRAKAVEPAEAEAEEAVEGVADDAGATETEDSAFSAAPVAKTAVARAAAIPAGSKPAPKTAATKSPAASKPAAAAPRSEPAAAPVTAQRKATTTKKTAAVPTKVVRAANTAETVATPRVASPAGSAAGAAPSEVIYDQPQQGRALDPSYHPARVKRYGSGWYLAGAQPANPGPMTEMVPTPEAVGDQGGPMDGEFEDGDPSMGGYSNGGGGFGGGGFGGGGLGGGGFGGGGLGYPGAPSVTTGGVGPNFNSGRRYSVIAAADMMWVRTRYSQAAALGQTDFTGSGNNTQFFQTERNFNPGYQGGFRTYVGIRDNCCGDECRFTFFNLQSAAAMGGTNTNTTSYCDFLCNQAPNPGDSVSTDYNQNASIFDIDCIRPFFFNPQCNNCCGPNCPVWDLRWFAGLRFAYINHNINSVVTDATNTVDGLLADAHSHFKFTGAGPRVGLQGRKYFGQSGRFSLYSRGSGALLVGSASQYVINTSHGGAGLGLTSNVLFSRNNRMIPAAEVELGATCWVIPRFAVSAGWNMQCFWDLGMQEMGSMLTPPLDTSNILGFESLFVRGEFVF
jgi:hypothetical protein